MNHLGQVSLWISKNTNVQSTRLLGSNKLKVDFEKKTNVNVNHHVSVCS